MFEKNLEIGLLLDFYGTTLTERKRAVMNLYYNEDFSLAEIADEVGISRQGVRDLIKKSESELFELEEKLGLAARFVRLRKLADDTDAAVDKCDIPDAVKTVVKNLTEAVRK